MTNKTVIIATSGDATWTVPNDFQSLTAVHGIGGGVCGSPGFNGAVDLESFLRPLLTGGTLSNGFAGPGGWYCKATAATTPLAVGQVLNLHVAAASAPVADLSTWENNVFGGSPPDCLSDDTWIKDNGGHYIIYAPGGDSSSGRVGSTKVQGGQWHQTVPKLVTGGGAGGAGGPAGVPDSETQDGAKSGFVAPTQIKLFGSGAGSGNLTQSAGLPGVGSRTAAGAGGGSGASAGGAGGDITGNLTVSSSLLLPSMTNPAASDAVKIDSGFLLGNGDYTIELWWQPIHWKVGEVNLGTLLSVWDTNAQRSWMLNMGASGGDGASPSFACSTDGAAETYFLWRTNATLATNYTSGGTYYGPPGNPFGWSHIAVCREGGAQRLFVDGYPCHDPADATHYTIADANNYFASTAHLTIGATLASGAINTVAGLEGNQTPMPGWFGNMRITIGSALYTCPAVSVPPLGQQFTPPVAALGGGNFNCDWPGAKGATTTTLVAPAMGVATFVGNAQIDSDQYCYPPASPEVGGNGVTGATGNLWTDGMLTVGPGGGGGGAGGDLSRYRMITGGAGGDGGNYGGGGGQGGGVNSGIYVGFGNMSAVPGLGGTGAQGLIVIEYVASGIEGNVSDTLTFSEVNSSQLATTGATTDALALTDVTDATLTPVTRPLWMAIGERRESIFPI